VFERGADYADAVWVIAPEFMLAELRSAVSAAVPVDGTEETVVSSGRIRNDSDVNAAADAIAEERAAARARAEKGRDSNLGLGNDMARAIIDPTDKQLDALRKVIALVFCEQFASLVAYGAGWSDRDRQQPVGDSDRFEPRPVDSIIEAELERGLNDPDPMRGIMQIVTRFAAAFVLDRNGVTTTTALGSSRMANRLARTLPDGPGELRTAIWELMGSILSPRLKELNRSDFVVDEELAPAADLAAHRSATALADVDLGEERAAA
jgi:hypothetical protein